MGHPERPALAPFPVLAAIAQQETSLVVGPLVARVGLTSTSNLIERFRSLLRVAPGRVVAPLGTGDHLSEAENLAYGLSYPASGVRRALLADAAEVLRREMPVWVGAGSEKTNDIARSLGVSLNFWDVEASDLAREAQRGEVNWSGNPRDDLAGQLSALRDAGATWAVFSPDVDLEQLGAWRHKNPSS